MQAGALNESGVILNLGIKNGKEVNGIFLLKLAL